MSVYIIMDLDYKQHPQVLLSSDPNVTGLSVFVDLSVLSQASETWSWIPPLTQGLVKNCAVPQPQASTSTLPHQTQLLL